MSKFIENISTLQNNTFALTPLLVSFYKNLKPTDKNILLAYFVLPLVLNNEFLEKIQKITGLDVRVFDDALTFKIALMVAKHMKRTGGNEI